MLAMSSRQLTADQRTDGPLIRPPNSIDPCTLLLHKPPKFPTTYLTYCDIKHCVHPFFPHVPGEDAEEEAGDDAEDDADADGPTKKMKSE